MENALEIKGLTKRWPDFCLEDLTMSVPCGAIVGLIGENGAGKTTTINLILHALERDSGEITVFGMDNIGREREVKELIGVVQDECNLPRLLTPGDVGRVMGGVYRTWDGWRFNELLRGLSLPAKKPLSQFSGGMRMKLSLAIALSHGSRLLILDEATAHLDPVARDELLDTLLEFIGDEGRSVLFSTHITSDLDKIADYAALLDRGRLIFYKSMEELKNNYGVLHCGERQFHALERGDVLVSRKLDLEYQALVPDRERAARKYPGALIDSATLDDIMLLYIKGDRP